VAAAATPPRALAVLAALAVVVTAAVRQEQVPQVRDTQVVLLLVATVVAARARWVAQTPTAKVATERRATGAPPLLRCMQAVVVLAATRVWVASSPQGAQAAAVLAYRQRVLATGQEAMVAAAFLTLGAVVRVVRAALLPKLVAMAVRALSSSDTRWPHNG